MCLGVTLAISVVFACLDYACIGQQRMDVLPVNIIELIWVCLLVCSVFTERGGSPLLVELGMGLFLLSGWIFHNIIIPLTIYTCGLVIE